MRQKYTLGTALRISKDCNSKELGIQKTSSLPNFLSKPFHLTLRLQSLVPAKIIFQSLLS